MYTGTVTGTDPNLVSSGIREITENGITKSYKYFICVDPFTESPREWPNVATFVQLNSRLVPMDIDMDDLTRVWNHFKDESLFKRYVSIFRDDIIYAAEFAYNSGHSTDGYGFVYITKDAWREAFPTGMSKREHDPAEVVKLELETYEAWAKGDVFVVYVNDGTNEVSLGGVYEKSVEETINELIKELG